MKTTKSAARKRAGRGRIDADSPKVQAILKDYLSRNYKTLKELAERHGVNPATIQSYRKKFNWDSLDVVQSAMSDKKLDAKIDVLQSIDDTTDFCSECMDISARNSFEILKTVEALLPHCKKIRDTIKLGQLTDVNNKATDNVRKIFRMDENADSALERLKKMSLEDLKKELARYV